MTGKEGISIIIVSYNVKELLLACLASVYAQKVAGTEVIVVDNSSSDGSVAAVAAAYPQAVVVENKANKGFSGANNQGIALSNKEYILLLNPDTVIKDGALEKMLAFIKTQEGSVLLGPRLLNGDGSLQPSCWKFPSVMQMFFETFFLDRLIDLKNYPAGKLDSTFEADALSGAAVLMHRSFVENNGGLDEDLFWMEDVDLCYRNRLAGRKNIYLRDAEIVHYSGKSSRNYNIVISNQLISKLKFLRKHKDAVSFFFACLFCFIHICSRILIFGLLSPFGETYRLKMKAYAFTFKKYFRYLFMNDRSVT
jgi:GT2 family glycosyltransferase